MQKKKLLVQYVLEDGFTISKAIKKLGLKLTTARLILQKFKETGEFPMRKFKESSKNKNIIADTSAQRKQIQKKQEYVN